MHAGIWAVLRDMGYIDGNVVVSVGMGCVDGNRAMLMRIWLCQWGQGNADEIGYVDSSGYVLNEQLEMTLNLLA